MFEFANKNLTLKQITVIILITTITIFMGGMIGGAPFLFLSVLGFACALIVLMVDRSLNRTVEKAGCCKKCNAKNPDNAEFCIECGCNLKQAELLKSQAAYKICCNSCGTEIPENAKHCPKCGVKINLPSKINKWELLIRIIFLILVLFSALAKCSK